MSNSDTMKQLIKQVSGQANILAIPRVYIAMMNNDLEVALFLSQSVYWSDKSKDPDGWFYKSATEWHEETGLSKHQITRCTDELEKQGLIITKIKKANGAPTKHFRVNLDNLMNSVFRFLESQKSGNQISQKAEMESEEIGKSLTETTQETTKKHKACESKKNKIIFSDWMLSNQDFMRTWGDFEEHRREIRKKLTPLAANKIIKKLNEFDCQASIAALNKSIENGWTGVFPENIKPANSNGHGHKPAPVQRIPRGV